MSGPLPSAVSSAIHTGNHIAVSILSGNRNFQARIHPEVKANYLASPPLVVAYALAGNIGHDMDIDPLGYDQIGEPVYLKDIWPSDEEIQAVIKAHLIPNMFKDSYRQLMVGTERWEQLPTSEEKLYPWDPDSTYLKRPPYFEQVDDVLSMPAGLKGLQLLVLLGDTITTDHISPSGAIQAKSPAGRYLAEHGIKRKDFNSYGLRRGNHEVGMRSAFANVQLRNELAGDCVGGYTPLMPDGELMPIFDTAMAYKARNRELLVIAGNEYGAGSSRDMAAKALRLIGVKAVIAESFERIHRTNLIGMGILPLQFKTPGLRKQLRLDGSELFDIRFDDSELVPGNKATLTVNPESGDPMTYALILRLDTPDEVTFYRHGGILPYVYRKFIDPKEER
jgi:aconitate hydratase